MKNTFTLCPELNKLRNKELSFGCLVGIKETTKRFWAWGDEWCLRYVNDEGLTCSDYNWEWGSVEPITTIIWHPITWWRVQHLYRETKQERDFNYYDCKNKIEQWLVDNKCFDQNELQWMESPHREELKELLIKFSNYL